MAMNNVYYRFVHLASNPEYGTLPAKLRMNIIASHGIEKADFELFSLAVSAMNGCGLCIDSHEKVLARPRRQARDDPGGGADRRGDEGRRDGPRDALATKIPPRSSAGEVAAKLTEGAWRVVPLHHALCGDEQARHAPGMAGDCRGSHLFIPLPAKAGEDLLGSTPFARLARLAALGSILCVTFSGRLRGGVGVVDGACLGPWRRAQCRRLSQRSPQRWLSLPSRRRDRRASGALCFVRRRVRQLQRGARRRGGASARRRSGLWAPPRP